MTEQERILRESMASHQAAIDDAEAKLKALSTPALRHGDYGYLPDGEPSESRLFTKMELDGRGVTHHSCIGAGSTWGTYARDKYIVTGNIFDDLKRNSEDLEEFEVRGIHARLDKYGMMHFGGFVLGSEGDQTAFYQKFGQMLATKRRQQ